MTSRSISGPVKLPDGTMVPTGYVKAVPVGTLPTSAAGLIIPVVTSFTISNGVISGNLVSPARFEFQIIYAGAEIWRWRADLVESAAATTLQDLYLSEPRDGEEVLPGILRTGDDVTRLLLPEGSPPGYHLTAGGDGRTITLVPSGGGGAGTGNMSTEQYDSNNDGKVDHAELADHATTAGSAATASSAPWAGISGKPSNFPPEAHTHDDRYFTEAETTALLAGKSNTGHDHDSRYYTQSQVDTALAAKASTGHTHDDRYFTEAETTALLAGKSDTGHNHDGRYYTQSQVDTALAAKASTGHTHLPADMNPAGSTAGQVMTSTGPTTAPGWATPSGGGGGAQLETRILHTTASTIGGGTAQHGARRRLPLSGFDKGADGTTDKNELNVTITDSAFKILQGYKGSIRAKSRKYAVDDFVVSMRNITLDVLKTGEGGSSPNSHPGEDEGEVVMDFDTASGDQDFELLYNCLTTQPGNGLGYFRGRDLTPPEINVHRIVIITGVAV